MSRPIRFQQCGLILSSQHSIKCSMPIANIDLLLLPLGNETGTQTIRSNMTKDRLSNFNEVVRRLFNVASHSTFAVPSLMECYYVFPSITRFSNQSCFKKTIYLTPYTLHFCKERRNLLSYKYYHKDIAIYCLNQNTQSESEPLQVSSFFKIC